MTAREPQPLIVHNHIPKTGGTGIRGLLALNYGAPSVLHVDRAGVGGPEATDEAQVAEWRRHFGSLPPEYRRRLRCITGHTAPLVMRSILDRPVRAFCMLRDPVELVTSLYLFMLDVEKRGGTGPAVALLKAMRERGWKLKDLYRELGDAPERVAEQPQLGIGPLFAPFFNLQMRQILLGVGSTADIPLTTQEELLRPHRAAAFESLSETYVVGTQDRFSQSIRLFAESFGWSRVFVPRANVGPPRAGDAIDQETRELIRVHNAVDAELHAHHSQRLAELPPVARATELRTKARMRASRLRARALRRGR